MILVELQYKFYLKSFKEPINLNQIYNDSYKYYDNYFLNYQFNIKD